MSRGPESTKQRATEMRVSRLYLPQALEAGNDVWLGEEPAHYVRTVLRLKAGAVLAVFDGSGTECPAVVKEIRRESVALSLGQPVVNNLESPLRTHLGLGISRGERMDFAIQKAVELGVSAITPVFTERCVVQLDETRKEQRLRHWRKIAQSACEQCGRNYLPVVHLPAQLSDWVAPHAGLKLFLHPHGGVSLNTLVAPEGELRLLSGPEGGFSEKEIRLAKEADFLALRLGPRILRTETAALAALAAVQTRWGDLGA
jgi:16S rRNA (uracil1498-N3)-methyltransferase